MYHMKKYIMHQMKAPLKNDTYQNNAQIRAGLYIFKKTLIHSFRREVFLPIFSSVNIYIFQWQKLAFFYVVTKKLNCVPVSERTVEWLFCNQCLRPCVC